MGFKGFMLFAIVVRMLRTWLRPFEELVSFPAPLSRLVDVAIRKGAYLSAFVEGPFRCAEFADDSRRTPDTSSLGCRTSPPLHPESLFQNLERHGKDSFGGQG